ncbi:MAG: thioredoxin family protein [Gammaproteobacteria bacterium]
MHTLRLLGFLLLAGCLFTVQAASPRADELIEKAEELSDDEFDAAASEFDDRPVEAISHPDWFKVSFLDLPEDLAEAQENGGKSLVVYFGQKHCAYCKALMEVNFGLPDIVEYTRKHFDIVPVDIWGTRDLTDLEGYTLTEREFAVREGTNFTPSLIFYGPDGTQALRLRGYYPPYKFRAALEYVADGHYRNERFRDYLARAQPGDVFEEGGLNHNPAFMPGPMVLDRSKMAGERPLLVVFEQSDCHACDLMHTTLLSRPDLADRLKEFEVVQLGLWADTPVLTPGGERLTAREWAEHLGLFYAPTLMFFDEWGREIIRVDSVVKLYRLNGVFDYVLDEGYLHEPNYLRWREKQRDEQRRVAMEQAEERARRMRQEPPQPPTAPKAPTAPVRPQAPKPPTPPPLPTADGR